VYNPWWKRGGGGCVGVVCWFFGVWLGVCCVVVFGWGVLGFFFFYLVGWIGGFVFFFFGCLVFLSGRVFWLWCVFFGLWGFCFFLDFFFFL